MNFSSTGKNEVKSVKCCVLYDRRNGAIRHVHRIVTMEGGFETPDDQVVERTLELAEDLGIDRAGVEALLVDSNAVIPGVSYAVDLANASLKEIGRINPKDLVVP